MSVNKTGSRESFEIGEVLYFGDRPNMRVVEVTDNCVAVNEMVTADRWGNKIIASPVLWYLKIDLLAVLKTEEK